MAVDPTTTGVSSVPVVGEHIAIKPGYCGGKPHVIGHRIKVQHIAVWHERMGMNVDEIVATYPGLSLSAVYAGPEQKLRPFRITGVPGGLPEGARPLAVMVTPHDHLPSVVNSFSLIDAYIGKEPGTIDYDIRSNTTQPPGTIVLRFHVFYQR